ncbi:iduronate 2-sulfatase isoform X1 [Euwallacea fornicatus]|uniref:iduronate 2-sulfatase isoform X1 n=1 Tax=Euwallacea fornicatus TaxID=995702 RepID=UPI00338F7244
MSRNNFFLCVLLLRFLKSSYCYRPNVLFLIVDDLKPALGCYGDSQAYTPNIDKIASKSFIFTQTFAQQALCAPSRNSFLTSRRPDTLHLYDFYSYWRDVAGNFTTIPQYFKERGYHSYSIGKVFHPGISSNFTDDQPYSWSQTPFHPTTIKFKDAKVCINQDGTRSANLICPVIIEYQPMATLPDIESKNEAIKFLHKRKRIVTNPPYFLAVGFHKPHIPFKFPEHFLDLHPLSNISLPVNRMIPPSLPTIAWNPWIDIRTRDDMKKLKIPFPYGPMNDEITKQIIQAYYASVSYVDELIGKVLREVDLDNTIVVLTGDHGWSLGEHGEFSKFSNFEEATRVPLIIHVPRLSTRKIIINVLVELVDLFPTLVDLTAISESLPLCPSTKRYNTCTEGRSLMRLMIDALRKPQNHNRKSAIFTQYPRPGLYPTLDPNSDEPRLKNIKIMGYSIKTKRYRYCEWVKFNSTNFSIKWNEVYARELYDHLIDPKEDLNLADRPQFSDLIKKLKRKLIKGWRKA